MYRSTFDLEEYKRLKARKAEIERLQREAHEKLSLLDERQADVERMEFQASVSKERTEVSLNQAQTYLRQTLESKERALEEEEEVLYFVLFLC